MSVVDGLRAIAGRLLECDPAVLDPDASPLELGFDSLLAIGLAHDAEAELGVSLPVADILAGRSLRELASAASATATRSGPTATARPDRLPLSPAQRRLWVLEQLTPGAYVLAGAIRLADTRDLGARLTRVVDRHEILRTVFRVDDTGPHQQVLPTTPVAVAVLPPGTDAVAALTAEPFDLASGPLLRAALVGDELVLAAHHIICDGWSLDVLLAELTAEPAGPPALQYADYALWHRDLLAGGERDRQLAHWRDRFADLPAPLELPVDHPRGSAPASAGAVHEHTVPAAVRAALTRLARDHGVTTFVLLHAAYATFLSRVTGQTDVVVGTPVANRPDPALDRLIGFFVNTLALRTELGDDPSFVALLHRCRATLLAAQQHQDLPFDELVDALVPTRAPGVAPLTQTLLTVRRPAERAGASARELHTGTARFDLSLDVEDTGEVFRLRWEYRTDLFEPASIARFAGWFSVLLHGIADSPQCPVSRLPLLTAAESTALADLGAGQQVEHAPLVLTRFASAVARFADRTALRAGTTSLSYAEFAARVRALAARLRDAGAGPERLVGLYAGRGIDTVVGLWAILCSGAGYLPLDPTHPPARLRQIVESARPVAVLADPGLPDQLPVPTLALDPAESDVAQSEVDKSTVDISVPLPDNLAYVLYTSGSTGVPKGVAVTHANLATLLSAMDTLLATPQPQTWLALTSTAFDISVVELIWTLTTGATTVLPDTTPITDQLTTITHLQTTPSYATTLLTHNPHALTTLTTLLLGGEPITQHLRDLLHHLPHTHHINGYGPTETTVYATTAPINPTATTTPIGTPLPGVTARVLDHNLAVTPTTGELCVGGGGVARGYLGNPRLTAARFVPDPHGEPGARLYRTGDLAHLAPSGELVFHGRADQQAKINGYRVELGEITAALTAHPAVRAAHTALTPGPEITAYLVGEVDLAELRAHLASQLPTWMHPAHLIPLTELPLTVNGKLDTGRLPLPTPVEQVHQPPRGDTEVAVAAIWSELLAVRNPSRTDDFFAAGGQSLLATQLIARVRVALGRQVALRAVFEHPTIAALAAHLDTCPPADRPLAPASRPARLPLSAAQRRIWVQTQLSTTDAYVIAGSIRTSGAVSTAELADRLTAVVARHEALRTSFPHDEHGPWQLVHPPAPVPLPVITPAERAAFVARPFDLAAGPLLRAATIRHDHDHGLELVVVVHHIACDGWSLGLLLAELAGAPTRPLAVQYADYTLWEAGRDHGRHLAHWRDRLADLPDPLRLPADRPRPVAWDGRGGNHHQVLDAGLTTRLRALAAERGASLFMLLAAAYGVLLGRLSGSRDVLIGTPVSHRPDPALDGLVGLFLNTVTLRLDLSDDPSAAELVDRAREAVLTAHEHQDVPFERVVRDLGGSTEQGTHPVFQTMLSVRPELPEAVTVNGVAHRAAALDTDTAKFDLSVEIVGVDGPTPALRWEYRTQLFDAATVARFAGHFHTLLTGIASAPATRVSRLPLLTAAQQDAALVRPAPVAAPGVLDRFRAAVANHGDRTAVAQAGRTLSYPEFAARAHALAARLRELGAGQETLVGLHAGRGIDTVVGLWAVLLAGAAYLPLDPTHPPARLRQIVESARPVAVLTEPALGPPPTSDVPVLDLAAPYPAAADAGVEPHPAALAYVLYTSGSTGVPKGVAVTHANLATLLSAMDTLLATPQPQTWLALTSTAFDISVVELIWTLTTGATTVLPDTTPITDQLTTITHLQTTPTYATTLLTHNPHALTTLTTLLLGGETITQHLRDLLHHLPHTHHINGYGPTETTVYATTAPIDPTATTTPIGTPLPGTGAVVVEPSLLPAPTGVVGELHLTGAGVSRGYLGNPRLTAQRFRPDPLGEPGARAYRTGDLAHRDAAGVLHFHGRADQQAKVRGYRIELGDITAALARHDQVRSAHTALGPDGDIVSYVVYAGEPVPDELARHLAEQLPAWMRPAHLVALDALPLTVNGKLDTRRLPVPAPVARPVLAPATAAEHRVAALFAELLAVPVDSVEDDFFRLGGHSLLATQLAARLGLPLRAVFDHSSVAALARQLDDRPSAPRTPVRRARPARLPLSPAQRRLWFLEQLAPGGYAVPVSVRISPRPDTARLAAALDALVRRHEALRTTFPQDAAGPHQHIAEARPIPLPTITPAERDEFLARPFDLAAGPLVRAALVTHTEHTEHAELLLVLHHIICDGWSLDLLLDELIAAVDGVLPTEAPTQYADYTLWQADLLAGGERDRQLAYWRTRLADPPAALRLPTDRPRPAGPSVRGAAHTHVLPAEVAAGLGALAAAHGTTLFTALYAAYAVLLSRLSGQSDVVVGTPVANRVRPELESAVGFLANTLALRTPVEAAIPFTDLLDRCHATVLGAQDHQDLPFEQLVEELRLPRDHTRNPLFQAMLTLRHERGPRTGASGHTYTTSGADTGAAKVDLTLAVRHDPEGGLELRWEHPTELFDTSTVAGFAECFAVLLGAVTAAPDTPVGALPLLSPPARRQALAHGVRAAAPGARTPVLDRFAARVAETPEAVALRDDSGTLTYRELDRRSRDLAAHLRGLGVGQETLVGLHAHRGIPLVVGILAILRAGGAYLPLDPAYPAGRVRQIVADARPPVVLFNSPPPELPGVRLVALDTAVPPAEVEPVRVHPDSLAYVIHTSGSTGTPKGVAVSHANLASSTSARFTVYSGPVRGLVLVSSPAFDTSVASIFWSLCAGAELCLPADGAQLDLDRLCELLARPAASHLVCLPSLYRLLLERFRDAPSALRAVAVAGEPVDAGLVALHHEITPEVALYNEYGPTENTVWSTVALLAPQPPGVSVPIGAPVPGSGAHVLDAELEPCPAGVVGEVHLSGAGLARGYLGNPRLTAARFRPDPHGAPGSRAYRTGDLAHRDADGWLHFRGRVDTQVKIRGYRVEPDEVTATLLRHPAVTAAHTTVHTGPAGPELVAHVVSGVDDAELRAHLAEHLPSWLRPAHLVALPALPLTPNGKVDSSALPAPAPAPVVVSAPATPTEERVSEVLRQLLGTAGIGVDHSFFDLGAHSLLLVRACELLRPLKPDLRVVDLFRYPTVRSLAAYLSGGGPDQQAGAGTDTGAGRARLTRRRARTTRQHPEPVSEPLEAP